MEDLAKQRIVIAGAGSAGIGVARVLVQAMIEKGCDSVTAKNCVYIVDNNGLLDTRKSSEMSPEQRFFARDIDGGMPLNDVVKKYRPTILLGMTGVGGLFTEEIVKEMAKHCERPAIFPLSNPTIKAECTAVQAFHWTEGRCIFASGSPFDPVTIDTDKVYYPTQCNNMYIFPGLGLGATLCKAKRVTDNMLYVAAEALANFVTDEELEQGKIFPPLSKIRDVSRKVAVAVIEQAMKEGQAASLNDVRPEDLETYVHNKMYYPEYVPLVEKRVLTI